MYRWYKLRVVLCKYLKLNSVTAFQIIHNGRIFRMFSSNIKTRVKNMRWYWIAKYHSKLRSYYWAYLTSSIYKNQTNLRYLLNWNTFTWRPFWKVWWFKWKTHRWLSIDLVLAIHVLASTKRLFYHRKLGLIIFSLLLTPLLFAVNTNIHSSSFWIRVNVLE